MSGVGGQRAERSNMHISMRVVICIEQGTFRRQREKEREQCSMCSLLLPPPPVSPHLGRIHSCVSTAERFTERERSHVAANCQPALLRWRTAFCSIFFFFAFRRGSATRTLIMTLCPSRRRRTGRGTWTGRPIQRFRLMVSAPAFVRTMQLLPMRVDCVAPGFAGIVPGLCSTPGFQDRTEICHV